MKSGREPQRKLENERRKEGRKEKTGVVIEQPSSRQRQTKRAKSQKVE